MCTASPVSQSRPKKRKRKLPIVIIDGVAVTLMPVHGKGNLPASMIWRMVREMKESDQEEPGLKKRVNRS